MMMAYHLITTSARQLSEKQKNKKTKLGGNISTRRPIYEAELAILM